MSTELLSGIRVIAFPDFLVGLYIGMHFAGMGAEVAKFEYMRSGKLLNSFTMICSRSRISCFGREN